MRYLASYIIVVAISLAAGAYLARAFFPRVVQPPPRVKYVDRPIAVRDTITVERPVTRTIYQTVTELRTDTIFVPKDFNYVGVVSPSPIRFDRGDVILTYFGLSDSAFVQDRFRVPQPKWTLDLSTLAGYEIVTKKPEIGIEANIRYKNYGLFGKARTTISDNSLTVGLRYYIARFQR